MSTIDSLPMPPKYFFETVPSVIVDIVRSSKWYRRVISSHLKDLGLSALAHARFGFVEFSRSWLTQGRGLASHGSSTS
jgi:hypothetical protein